MVAAWREGSTQWMHRLMSEGWTLYYVNFMFGPLSGPPPVIIQQMKRAITKFYGRFSLEFVRDGRAASAQGRMPVIWLFPDLPVFKYLKQSLRQVTLNGGYHYNGPMLIPPVSRFNECPIKHMKDHHDRYARYGIERVNVVPGYYVPGLASYSTKTIANGGADDVDIIVFPRSVDLLAIKTKPHFDPRQRLLKDIQSSLNVSDDVARHLRDKLVQRRA
jgi:hypothetical protein